MIWGTLKRLKYRVNISDFRCDCIQYYNRATCEHLVLISHNLGMSLGYYKPVTKFVILKKRGRPRRAANSLKKD